jgi:large subunit ribosomal protein L29
MKAEELRNMSLEELKMKVRDAKADLFKITHQLESRQSEDTSRRTLMKREIARILTVINEKMKKGEVSGRSEKGKVEKEAKLEKDKKSDERKEHRIEKESKGEVKEEKKIKTRKEVKPKREKKVEKKTKPEKVAKSKKEK